jgi:hypothetical protein
MRARSAGSPIHNDVALLEGALKGFGFEVVTVHDAGLGSLYQPVNAYARRLQAAQVRWFVK